MDARELDELLDHLLELSRLTLKPEEREEFRRKFGTLLEFVDAVNRSEIASGVGRAPESGSLSYRDALPLRGDDPWEFEFDENTVHNYTVPRIIDDPRGSPESEGGDV